MVIGSGGIACVSVAFLSRGLAFPKLVARNAMIGDAGGTIAPSVIRRD